MLAFYLLLFSLTVATLLVVLTGVVARYGFANRNRLKLFSDGEWVRNRVQALLGVVVGPLPAISGGLLAPRWVTED